MKKLATLILIIAVLVSCKPEPKVSCLVSGTIKNATEKELIRLTIGTKVDTLVLTAEGTFSKEISLTKPSEAFLQGSKLSTSLYLVPGKDLTITADASAFNKDLVFGGSLAAENDFILKKGEGEQATYELLNAAYRSPYTPADFKRIRDSIRLADLDFIEKFSSEKGKLDPAFIERMKTAAEFSYYADMNNYPMMTSYYNTDKPEIPADWHSYLDGVNLDDPSLLDISDAKYFISSYVSAQALKISGVSREESYNNPEVRKAMFQFLTVTFKNPEFYNVFAFDNLKGTIDSQGPTGLETEIADYMTRSTNEENKKILKEMTDSWASMAAGQTAPVFNLPDIDGKMFSLTDFAGKYVYIDFWATWCGPCKAEIPAYKKLIEDYAGKNIVFISISVDKDKVAWENMVKAGIPDPADKEKMISMTWLQLHDAVKYNKIWLVRYIPTFVMIDREGKILNSRADRPSDPDLRPFLDSLTGL
jgi:thiol-disulfide isomerase/thioredoxin